MLANPANPNAGIVVSTVRQQADSYKNDSGFSRDVFQPKVNHRVRFQILDPELSDHRLHGDDGCCS